MNQNSYMHIHLNRGAYLPFQLKTNYLNSEYTVSMSAIVGSETFVEKRWKQRGEIGWPDVSEKVSCADGRDEATATTKSPKSLMTNKSDTFLMCFSSVSCEAHRPEAREVNSLTIIYERKCTRVMRMGSTASGADWGKGHLFRLFLINSNGVRRMSGRVRASIASASAITLLDEIADWMACAVRRCVSAPARSYIYVYSRMYGCVRTRLNNNGGNLFDHSYLTRCTCIIHTGPYSRQTLHTVRTESH